MQLGLGEIKKERAFQIKTPSGWKIAGKVLFIKGEWSFYREIYNCQHAFHTFEAWSIQANLFETLEKDGVRWICQFDKESRKMYRIS